MKERQNREGKEHKENIMSEHQPQLISIQFLFVSCMQFNSIQLIHCTV